MAVLVDGELDFVEELKLRRWAREHYVPRPKRETEWHPVVHEEMRIKDLESIPHTLMGAPDAKC